MYRPSSCSKLDSTILNRRLSDISNKMLCRYCVTDRSGGPGADTDTAGAGGASPLLADDVVYDVFYYVQLPASAAGGGGGGFKTQPVRRTVRLTQSELDGVTSGITIPRHRDVMLHVTVTSLGVTSGSSHRVDFLDVEHDAGLSLHVCLSVCLSLSLSLLYSDN